MEGLIEARRNPLANRKQKRKRYRRRWEARRKIGPHAWTVGYGRTRRGALRDLRRVEGRKR